ncbi:MAG: hypothetical protein PUG64_03155, partial [Bacteroidales bacterium]|nr:hypothetical protein [Bacteroidales bacterium]
EHLGYTQKWREAIHGLSIKEKETLFPIIFKNDFSDIEELTSNEKLRYILRFYKNYRADIANQKSELYQLKKQFDGQNKIK